MGDEEPLQWGQPAIDALLIADAAEAINGKLYVMGGGFDTVWVGDPEEPYRCAFGALLRIPWDRTNEKIPVVVALSAPDGAERFRGSGQVVSGRAPTSEYGQDMLVAFSGPLIVPTDTTGRYTLRFQFGPSEKSLPLAVRLKEELLPGP